MVVIFYLLLRFEKK
ncbi:hypothetical protein ABEY96_15820 [Priestia aryabhattai]